MADCATAEDAVCARAAGAEILATTLCGYTQETKVSLARLAMVRELAELDAFAVCEAESRRRRIAFPPSMPARMRSWWEPR